MFLFVCLMEILNKRIISLHYLLFLASRYFLIQNLLNSLKNKVELHAESFAMSG